jgi:hypothetical protein
MTDDELRARLRAADPARHDEPAPSWIDDLVEATVQDETMQENDRDQGRRARWLVPAAAAAAVAGIAAAAVLAFGGDDDDNGNEAAAPETVQLELAVPDAMQMCVMLDADVLQPVPVALEGTVTDIEGGTVTLDVTQWFKGGDAEVVELVNPGQADDFAMIEDFLAFEEGKRYLIVAEDGVVSGCLSGEWSEQSAAIFDEAFGG